MGLLDAEDLAALRVLRDALGWAAALSIGLRLRLRVARGEPFAELPPAEDARERASRAQVAGAVVLYRLLARARPAAQARSLTARVVHAAALAYLDRQVGALPPDVLTARSPEARRAFVAERLQRFPNVVASVDAAQADGVRFTVHRCRLVELVQQAGHAELAPLFCAADAAFFGGSRPGLRLDRPTTLAAGDPACAFHIHRSEQT